MYEITFDSHAAKGEPVSQIFHWVKTPD